MGPRARVAQLRGGASLNGSISLQPGNGWVHEHHHVLGYDCHHNPVCAGDVLVAAKDPPGHPHAVRFLVTGPAAPDDHGPCVEFQRLRGSIPGFDRISLRPANCWLVETVKPQEPMLPSLAHLTKMPRLATSAFTLDDHDPFTLD